MDTTKNFRRVTAGDAAVEGLLGGIAAGIVMALVLLGFQFAQGVAPLAAMGYFDVLNAHASPFVGVVVHLAIAGVYGLLFGLVWMILARVLRMGDANWIGIVVGALYGVVVLGIAETMVLPRTSSPLREMPLWEFGLAHIIYGMVLGWIVTRKEG